MAKITGGFGFSSASCSGQSEAAHSRDHHMAEDDIEVARLRVTSFRPLNGRCSSLFPAGQDAGASAH
jgi:hypothetical protein